jgi:hypothetical protein
LSFAGKWMEMENMILSEVSKERPQVFSQMWNIDPIQIQ